jgi:hypothetical protein
MRKSAVFSCLAIAVLLTPFFTYAQTNPAASSCPVVFVHVDRPDYVNRLNLNVRIQNKSATKIVGMTFDVAIADAAEEWEWIPNGPRIAEFDWNREVNSGQSKSLSWYLVPSSVEANYIGENYYHEHSSGGAVVLTKVLFSDGTSWEDAPGRESCMGLWFNPHKKFFAKPIQLPPR